MARFNSYITNAGKAEIARILAEDGKFTISRIEIGNGRLEGGFAEVSKLASKLDIPVVLSGVSYIEEDDPYFKIVATVTNEGLEDTAHIRELGVYIHTPIGEKLGIYSVLDASDDTDNILPPPSKEGLLVDGVFDTIHEQHVHVYFRDLPLSADRVIVVVAPGDTLTIIAADGRYWKLGVKYPATEIMESNGRNTEEHQRWQDEQLTVLIEMVTSGTTNATPADLNQWRIINYNGYYDRSRSAYMAGRYIPLDEGKTALGYASSDEIFAQPRTLFIRE